MTVEFGYNDSDDTGIEYVFINNKPLDNISKLFVDRTFLVDRKYIISYNKTFNYFIIDIPKYHLFTIGDTPFSIAGKKLEHKFVSIENAFNYINNKYCNNKLSFIKHLEKYNCIEEYL